MEILSVVFTDILRSKPRTAILFDHSLFMYIALHFQYTLEISLKRRVEGTGMYRLIYDPLFALV